MKEKQKNVKIALDRVKSMIMEWNPMHQWGCRTAHIRMCNTCTYAFETFSLSLINDNWETTTAAREGKLQKLTRQILTHLTRIHEFHWNSDKFSCDSAMVFFFERDWFKSEKIIISNRPPNIITLSSRVMLIEDQESVCLFRCCVRACVRARTFCSFVFIRS